MQYLTILHRDGLARSGVLHLPHGDVQTPAFMPVGTQATVKAITKDDLAEIGFDLILANTYHLYLRPGVDLIEEAGGLHGFSGWKRNFLTDSGGFQVFSLSPFRKITMEGVTFQSHLDGSRHTLTPERIAELQCRFNSDIQMQLDVCTGYEVEGVRVTHADALEALMITTDWAKRAKSTWEAGRDGGYEGLYFPIVQGNFFEDLRERSAEEVRLLDTPGVAIGGLSVGEPPEVYEAMLAYTARLLPQELPHYVMGIGTPDYILQAIENGIDLFDCVLPTRNARNGSYFTRDGFLSIKKEQYARDFGPVDPACDCKVCREYSRAYLRHLYKAGEILSAMLASYHNLYFLHQMMREVRAAIDTGTFARYKADFLRRFSSR